MKLRIASDLHLDLCSMRALPDVGADAALVAGDSFGGRLTAELPGILEALFPEPAILIVCGNHEGYWHDDFHRMQDILARACLGTRVSFLERQAVELGGAAILGATLWTDFNLFGARRRDDCMNASACSIMDYRAVRTQDRALIPDDTLAWHLADRAWIAQEIKARQGQKIIVMTHHAPSRESLAKKHAYDLASGAFVSELDPSEFDGVSLWIHGHTHSSFDYMAGNCRVVCNPRGYTSMPDVPIENPWFNPDLVIEV